MNIALELSIAYRAGGEVRSRKIGDQLSAVLSLRNSLGPDKQPCNFVRENDLRSNLCGIFFGLQALVPSLTECLRPRRLIVQDTVADGGPV